MPEIIVTLGGTVVNRYVFEKDIVSIGRSRDNDLFIENLAVSRNHARIRQEGGRFFITDLNSANGTFVNGKQITKSELSHNDTIVIGKHSLLFKSEVLSDVALISDAFGAERTMVVSRVPTALLRVIRGKQKDQEFRVDKAEVTIGRGKGCGICLPDWFVGKEHAVIRRRGTAFVLRDVGSWRGTKVNDQPVTETALKDGDEIQIGGTRFLFSLAEEAGTPPGVKPVAPEALKATPVPFKPPERVSPKQILHEVEREEEPILAGGENDFIEASAAQGPLGALDQDGIESEVLFEDLESELAQKDRPPATASPAKAFVTDVPTPAPMRVEPPARAEAKLPGASSAVAAAASPDDIRMWEEALRNKSSVIRKQAAKMLKKMTGRDYDH